jgi:hypothetical protein
VLLHRFPRLRARILALAATADRHEGWGVLVRQGDAGAKRATGSTVPSTSDVNVRVAEYHEMSVGGRVGGRDHYDVGSLVTVDVMLEEPTAGGRFQVLVPPSPPPACAAKRTRQPIATCAWHPATSVDDAMLLYSGKGVRLAQKMQVGPCIHVGIHL